MVTIRRLGQPGDLGWVLMAHGELYAREFGWNGALEALVARIVADFAAPAGADGAGPAASPRSAWVAEAGGRRVGCVFCVPADEPGVARLRILLVDPAARGHGLGGRLVDECLAFAAGAGYTRMRLWTNHPLLAARAIYLSRGFELVSEDAEPHHDFGVPLRGQVYERPLDDVTGRRPIAVDVDGDGGTDARAAR